MWHAPATDFSIASFVLFDDAGEEPRFSAIMHPGGEVEVSRL
jgi:hypothetical protein